MKNKILNQSKNSKQFLRKFVCGLVFVLSAQLTFAQSLTVKGRVNDTQGEPIPGVSILVKGTTNGTITDLDGKFSINVPSSKSVLVFSFVGMVTQEKVVGKNLSPIITLKDASVSLNEVVAIGYGSVKKSSLTGAVSKINVPNMGDRPISRPEVALQGSMPGVEVRTTTGQPGQDIQVRVRGAASVNASSNPLYVVDGSPVESLAGINPNDIASIEVLKDAASAAIYGSRGSNGVVLITTKSGTLGKDSKPIISFSATYGVQSLQKKLDLMSATDWIKFRIKYNDAYYLEQAKAHGVTNASISDNNATRMANIGGSMSAPNYNVILDPRWFNVVSAGQHTYTKSPEQLSLLDWQNNYFREATTQEYNLSVTGSSKSTSYMISSGYLNQQGIVVGTGYSRFSARANIETKIKKWLTAGMIMAPTYTTTLGGGLANGKDSQTHHAIASTPVSEPGVGYMTNVAGNAMYHWAYSASSPSYVMETNLNQEHNLMLTASSFIRITPFKGMQIQATASTNMNNTDGEAYTYTEATKAWNTGEGAASSGSHTSSTSFDNSLFQVVANYNNTFGQNTVNGMLGYSAEQSNMGYTTNQTFNKPFPNDALPQSFDGSILSVGKDIVTELTPTRLMSFFGRAQYNYADKYFVSASVRRDGGSVFGSSNKWGTFPAVSGAWQVSQEPFFKALNINAINMLKLRASYGVTGNNSIPETASYALLSAVAYGGQAGYSINTAGNPDLHWEKSNSTDLAVDLGLLSNRIQLSFDYYTKKTYDLLYEIPVPAASGFTIEWGNLGDIDNHGYEIELNTHNLVGKFKWETNFNLAYNQNIVRRLGATNTPVYSGFDKNNVSNVLEVGKPMNEFYMYKAIGVWKSQAEIDAFSAAHNGVTPTFNGKTIQPGDIRYKDINGDGIFTIADKTYLGSPTPNFTYGMTNTFSYKNFDLSILLTAQTGGKIFGVIGRQNDRAGMGAAGNELGDWRNAWWSESDPGNGTTPYILSTTTGTTLDSRWLYSSDYLEIKNITFGYKLPPMPKVYTSARVFISCENLAILDSYYGGYSPEAANSGSSTAPGGGNALGIDYGGYPTAKTISMGINVNF